MHGKLSKKILSAMFFAVFFLTAGYAFADESTAAENAVVLDLDKAIQMALDNNPKTMIASGNLKSAAGSVKQALGQYGPQIVLQHTENRVKNYTVLPINITESFNNSASVSLPVYTGGARRGNMRTANRNYEIAKLEIGRTDQEVKLDATTAYYTVLQTRNLVALGTESVARLQEHLKNVQAQFDVGIVAKVDVLRSQVELANSQQDLIKAQNSYDVAVASLNNVVGLPLETQTVVDDELAHSNYAKSLEDCIDFSRQHQPQIIQAAKAVEAARGGVMAARSGYLPNISISAGYGWGDREFPGDEKSSWNVSATMNFTLFDSNITRGRVDSAQGTLVQRQASYQQIRDNVFLAVRSSYLSLREAEKRIETASVTVETAEEDYKIALVRYQAGVGTNTDVLDAQVALTQAKTNYVQALYDYNTSWANLENAMGVPVPPRALR
ncbi:MAG: TolC family protein [Acidaminococcales bacterium]|jgi:TolC family type I secretion outer membrane protein|nr:TolC family protein [Acidaminococcales bacterium]